MPKFTKTRQMIHRTWTKIQNLLAKVRTLKGARRSTKITSIVLGILVIIYGIYALVGMAYRKIAGIIMEQIPSNGPLGSYLGYADEVIFGLIFTLLPLGATRLVYKAYRKRWPKKQATPTPSPSSNGWNTLPNWLAVPHADTLWLIAGWGFLLFFPLLFGTKEAPDSLRNWWWNNVLTDKVGWGFISGFTLFGAMMLRNTPFRYKLAPIGISVLVVAAVGVYGWRAYEYKKAHSTKTTVVETATTSSTSPSELADVTYSKTFAFPPELEGNENARKVYDQLMADESLSRPDRYNLFFICGEETSFSYSQFEEDGVTPLVGHNREREDNGARGVCQIKPEFHAKTAEELTASTGQDHRIETFEGNVRLASYILRTEGGRRWESLPRVLARANGTATLTETLARRESPAVLRPAPQAEQFFVTRMEKVDLPDEPEVLSIDMPIGGNPTRQIKCSRPTCSFVTTAKVKYSINGGFYNLGSPNVRYNIGVGQVRFLDGRGLFSYEVAHAPTETVTITQ